MADLSDDDRKPEVGSSNNSIDQSLDAIESQLSSISVGQSEFDSKEASASNQDKLKELANGLWNGNPGADSSEELPRSNVVEDLSSVWRNMSEEMEAPSSPSSSGYAAERGSSNASSRDIGIEEVDGEILEIGNSDPLDRVSDSQVQWLPGKRHGNEDDASSSWRKRKKHFFVLSHSGKPIYSRYGDEHKLAGFSATLQAIISFVENGGDRVNLVRAGKHQVVFLVEGPIYLACISCTEESYQSLKGQLELLYGQMILILTKNPANFLHAYTCLPLAYATRQAASAILQDVADSGVVFAILMCKHKVISLVGAQKASLHPDDMLLLSNFIMSSESFRQVQLTFDSCLGHFLVYLVQMFGDDCVAFEDTDVTVNGRANFSIFVLAFLLGFVYHHDIAFKLFSSILCGPSNLDTGVPVAKRENWERTIDDSWAERIWRWGFFHIKIVITKKNGRSYVTAHIRTSESFSPICLPRYNPMAFLHAYVHYLDVDTYLILLSTSSDAFHHLKDCRIRIEKVLLESNVLNEVQRSMVDGGMRVEDLPADHGSHSRPVSAHLGQPGHTRESSERFAEAFIGVGGPAGLWHFMYRSIYLDQYVSSEISSPVNNRQQQKRLYRAYQKLYASMHDKEIGPHTTQFRRDENYVLLCWVTQDFELYAAFDPLADKALAIKTCNRVCQWIKNMENEIFLLGASAFSW
ncbi:hypothetical protein RND71_029618 [Anisodus tanguticus]|uniref:Vacuolar fusion protein MON1 homolog n=1 Tax=Anisodus tanguticus TaxID=243964 RepID=A0AAE1V7E0_9SOLA|nr:hypothetical protein RND71_029618 [Anisodus tanguticus]